MDRLTPRQQQIAAIIIGRGQLRKLPSKALVIAVAVGQDESNLLNLANPSVPESMSLPNDGMGHDHASVGVFQQQPWWGSIPDLMNPAVASDKFYDALLKVPDWQAMPVATAAATVQRNLNGAADYARYEAAASQIVTRIAPALAPVNDMAACAAFGSSAIGRRIAAAAASQIGVTYAWGGGDITGPTQGKHDYGPADRFGDYLKIGWDCSGLTQWSVFQATRKAIARTSEAQSAGGTPIDPASAQPGDLVFFGGTATAHHVGVYLGKGLMVDAPQSGEKVRQEPVAGFGGPVTYRRYG
ncbi:hypothetical protein AWN90_19065 [Nocardia terpenica]|uniref:NlpC/P60 domain-containing protein n=1 Tax=Nocardia terpenica TaxID=455432 RepID=A0A164PF32_9NOCA|nr:hypothetical protein AWN90_19065 [Nocardia terpenica]